MGKWDNEIVGRRTVRWWGQVAVWQWDFLIQSIKGENNGLSLLRYVLGKSNESIPFGSKKERTSIA
jgi:hypothetical protein